ncbi:MAG: FAD-dependent oxidoreductase [Deltaproteobacteria bacterium]|nr:FAD-dependent oxidoreductase [Deltaproteobacteria bacterium]
MKQLSLKNPFIMAPIKTGFGNRSGEGLQCVLNPLMSRDNEQLLRSEQPKRIAVVGGYDEVILATGAKPAIPPIKGLTKYLWAEVLENEHLPANSNVVVIGGGLIGIEIAHKLVGKIKDAIRGAYDLAAAFG